MKISFFIITFFVCSKSLPAQTDRTNQKGTYFKTTPGEYFDRVIKPWKYQHTEADNSTDSAKKIGKIIFWRSSSIYDNVFKKYWKPDISFDIYPNSASE